MLKSTKIGYGVAGVLAGISLASPVIAQELLSFNSGASVFSQESKTYSDYEAIAGQVRYVRDDEGGEEGYSPDSTISISGRFDRRVLDHRETASAELLYRSALTELSEGGFDIIYRCERQECGDVAGWRLFLSRDVDGYIGNQFYALAALPEGSQPRKYVALYVNEFSDQPRTIVDTVAKQGSSQEYAAWDKARTVGDSASSDAPQGQVYFEFNSAELSRASKRRLDEVIESFVDGDQAIRFHLVGHTDDVGEAPYNEELSRKRAQSVKEYLLSRPEGLREDQVQLEAAGGSRPMVPNIDKRSRAYNRRVEIRVDEVPPTVAEVSGAALDESEFGD